MRAGAARRVGSRQAPPRAAPSCHVLSLCVCVYVGRVDVRDRIMHCVARLRDHSGRRSALTAASRCRVIFESRLYRCVF